MITGSLSENFFSKICFEAVDFKGDPQETFGEPRTGQSAWRLACGAVFFSLQSNFQCGSPLNRMLFANHFTRFAARQKFPLSNDIESCKGQIQVLLFNFFPIKKLQFQVFSDPTGPTAHSAVYS